MSAQLNSEQSHATGFSISLPLLIENQLFKKQNVNLYFYFFIYCFFGKLFHFFTEIDVLQVSYESIFVGSGIFKSDDPSERAKAIVMATTNYDNPDIVAQASEKLGDAMPGLEMGQIPEDHIMQDRGW